MRALFIGGPEHLTEREVDDKVSFLDACVLEPRSVSAPVTLTVPAYKVVRYSRTSPVYSRRSGRVLLHIFVSEEEA